MFFPIVSNLQVFPIYLLKKFHILGRPTQSTTQFKDQQYIYISGH